MEKRGSVWEVDAVNPFVLLGVSVVFQVLGDTCMKLSNGFQKKVPIIGLVLGYIVSFYALSACLYAIPLGVAYAIWSSAAVVLTAIVGRIIWGELFNVKKSIGIVLIVLGVVALRLGVA